jgi:hypothetical protein
MGYACLTSCVQVHFCRVAMQKEKKFFLFNRCYKYPHHSLLQMLLSFETPPGLKFETPPGVKSSRLQRRSYFIVSWNGSPTCICIHVMGLLKRMLYTMYRASTLTLDVVCRLY